MSTRLDFYIRYMYTWAGVLYYVPVKYKFGKGHPDILVPVKRNSPYQIFGFISTFAVASFILYLYYEVCFGQTTWLEKMFVIGFNSAFSIVYAGQWQFILSRRRRCGLNVMNAALSTEFQNSTRFPYSFEIICFLLCFVSFTFPIIYFPFILLTALYFPGAFHLLHIGIDSVVMGITSNSELILTYGTVARWIVYAVISVGICHALVNTMVTAHWLFTYLFATTQRVDDMLKQKR